MSTTTFIAILDFSVSPVDRPVAVAHLAAQQPTVEAMPGCVAFRYFPSPDSDTDITVLHEWTGVAGFEDYLASAAFVRSGETLRPMMTGVPSSRRFQVRLVEAVA